jgi:ABC-type branched-subunit amino acid transport system ATPase component
MSATQSSENTPAPLLEARGLGHSFGGLSVLRDVSFQVPQGSITGLIGPNGSGKTTCFNIMSGFLRPRLGEVRFDDLDVTAATVQQRSRQGMVRTFQAPQVFRHLSVLENLMMGCHKHTANSPVADMLRLAPSRRVMQRMEADSREMSRRFGLDALLDRPAGSLPAGQMRLVELARACVGKPRLLMLDEPSSGLSSSEIDTLRDWIRQINAEGLTVLLVSHDMGLMNVAHNVNVLYFGEIIATGDMAAIQADVRVREAYLGA